MNQSRRLYSADDRGDEVYLVIFMISKKKLYIIIMILLSLVFLYLFVFKIMILYSADKIEWSVLEILHEPTVGYRSCLRHGQCFKFSMNVEYKHKNWKASYKNFIIWTKENEWQEYLLPYKKGDTVELYRDKKNDEVFMLHDLETWSWPLFILFLMAGMTIFYKKQTSTQQ